jgi:hypothetical protein
MKDLVEPQHEEEQGSVRIGVIFLILSAILVSWFCILIAIALGCVSVLKVIVTCLMGAEAVVHWLGAYWDFIALTILSAFVLFMRTSRLVELLNAKNFAHPLRLKLRACCRRL